MPTGYTSYIEDGKINTGKDFLELCCRAFGVCVGMREDGLSEKIPNKFIPDDYYEKRLNDAIYKLDEAKRMTIEEAENEMRTKYENKVKEINECVKNDKIKREKYLVIKNEIEQWTPPTEEHINLKKFAMEQIDMSIPDHDKFYEEELNRTPVVSPEKYVEDNIKWCVEQISNAAKSYYGELDRVQKRNEWLDDFRNSFNDKVEE